jgi:hypothetical protein
LRNEDAMIRKLTSGKYRLYSRKKNPKTGRRRNLGTFATRGGGEARARGAVFQAALGSGGASFRNAGASPRVRNPYSQGAVMDSGLAMEHAIGPATLGRTRWRHPE